MLHVDLTHKYFCFSSLLWLLPRKFFAAPGCRLWMWLFYMSEEICVSFFFSELFWNLAESVGSKCGIYLRISEEPVDTVQNHQTHYSGGRLCNQQCFSFIYKCIFEYLFNHPLPQFSIFIQTAFLKMLCLEHRNKLKVDFALSIVKA